jgi:hypothetical protein
MAIELGVRILEDPENPWGHLILGHGNSRLEGQEV